MTEKDELTLQPLLHTAHSSNVLTADPSHWKQILKNLVLPTLLHVGKAGLATRAGSRGFTSCALPYQRAAHSSSHAAWPAGL